MVLSKMNNHEHRTKQTYESYTFQPLRDLSEISREGGRGVEIEGGSQLFETAEKGGVVKNGLLGGGGSCKYVSVIM